MNQPLSSYQKGRDYAKKFHEKLTTKNNVDPNSEYEVADLMSSQIDQINNWKFKDSSTRRGMSQNLVGIAGKFLDVVYRHNSFDEQSSDYLFGIKDGFNVAWLDYKDFEWQN
jgi:hypothetical protein